MSVELLQALSLIAYILAGLLFVLAVFLFFYLKVPALWGEVSGRTARKAIQAMKWKGEEATSQPAKRADAAVSHEKAPLIAAEQKPPLKTEAEVGQTDILPAPDAGQTELLPQPAAVVCTEETGETAVLRAARATGELPRMDETALLTQKEEKQPGVFFVMEKELAFTDSTEIIE